MPDQNPSDSPGELFFYVEEGSDDFTFYLARDKTGPANGQDDDLRARLRFDVDAGTGRRHQFSFSDKVRVKTLLLSADSIIEPTVLNSSLGPHQYLQTKVDAQVTGKLKEKIVSALNEIISNEGLPNESWVVDLSPAQNEFLESIPDPNSRKKWRNRLLIEKTFPDLIEPSQLGRGLFCLAHSSEYVSATVRRIREAGNYRAVEYPVEKEIEKRKKNLFSIAEYCAVLEEQVMVNPNAREHAHGLLVITGSTKSAKSEIARGLIDRHMCYLASKNGRTPHLVTFEDPIEVKYSDLPRNKEINPWNLGLKAPKVETPEGEAITDYTPREKEKDAGPLRKALEDALRQTPAVFFVGETRRKTEWELLLDFASTGHLIVTTAHAGSLVEAMHKIFEARQVKTAGDRSEIANKLLAVIHIGNQSISFSNQHSPDQRPKPDEIESATNVLFPALWRRTPRGAAALTSDGLSSLLPHQPHPLSREDPPSCVGRGWFIERLITTRLNGLRFDGRAEIEKKAGRRAAEWDLEGV